MKYVVINLKQGAGIITVPEENVRDKFYKREGRFWVRNDNIYDTLEEAKAYCLTRYQTAMDYHTQRVNTALMHYERIAELTEEQVRHVDNVTSQVINRRIRSVSAAAQED
jgi:hypothetical protein